MKSKRILSLLLLLVTVLGLLAGCGEAKVEGELPSDVESEETGVTFPLEEPYTIDIMFKGSYDWETNLEKSTYYQKLCADTNVYINPINLGDEPMTTLNAMLSAGNEGEAIMGGVLNDSQLIELAYGGFLMPIEDYVLDPAIMPNYHERGLSELPQAVGVMTAPDGHIYGVARINRAQYSSFESPVTVNKKWVEASGADISTIEGFEEYLIWVRDNDANGNGNANDEVPFLLANDKANAYCTLQAVMGWWGMPTKNSTLDAYVTVENGEVKFVPTMDGYKDAIKTLSRWYEEGLIWSEYYTANTETFNAKLNNNEICMFGCVLYPYSHNPSYTFLEELEYVAPPAIEGYKARMYYNCGGAYGRKNTFSLTNKCERPDIVLAWLDQMYSAEGSVGVCSNLETDPIPRYQWNDDGSVTYFDLSENYTEDEIEQLEIDNPTLDSMFGSNIWLRSSEDYEKGVWSISGAHSALKEAFFGLYAEYVNQELWPRPYYTEEAAEEVGILRTDIFDLVTEMEARWIVGDADIEADWEDFKARLNTVGIDRYVELMQEAYDVFLHGMAAFE